MCRSRSKRQPPTHCGTPRRTTSRSTAHTGECSTCAGGTTLRAKACGLSTSSQPHAHTKTRNTTTITSPSPPGQCLYLQKFILRRTLVPVAVTGPISQRPPSRAQMACIQFLHAPQFRALLAGFLSSRKSLFHVAAAHVPGHRVAHSIQRT